MSITTIMKYPGGGGSASVLLIRWGSRRRGQQS